MVAGSPIKEVTQQFAPKAHLQGKPAKTQYVWHMLAVALAVKLYPDTWQSRMHLAQRLWICLSAFFKRQLIEPMAPECVKVKGGMKSQTQETFKALKAFNAGRRYLDCVRPQAVSIPRGSLR